MPIPDLVHEYLQVEQNISLPVEERSQKLIALIEKIVELRPLYDPMIIIGRYRPCLG